MLKITPSIFLTKKSVEICSRCNQYLSAGPITIFSGKPVCGRCPPVTDCPALFYEKLAEYMFFPCINDRFGCDTMLAWGTVLSHEEKCKFFPAECPALKCNDKIKKENIVEHFETRHSELMTTPGELCGPLADEPVNKLLLWKKEIFILKIDCTLYPYYFEVSSWKNIDSNKLKYDILVEDQGKGHTISIISVPIVTYQGKYHDISTMSKIGWYDTKTVLNAAELAIKITTDSTNNTLLNRKLLSEIKCPICTNYLKPPVFVCAVGHSFCNSCKSNISQCPICQAEMKADRNFLLEKMIEHIMFPCKYDRNGCGCVGILSDMNVHEENCQFRVANDMICYMNYSTSCSWKGPRSEVMAHLSNVHPGSYIDLNNPLVLDLLTHITMINAFTEYDTHIFKVQITYDKSRGLQFSVKLVSDRQKQSCRFFVNFKDRNENHRFFSLNKFCNITNAENDNLDHCIYISNQIIHPFVQYGLLEVKLNIVEI